MMILRIFTSLGGPCSYLMGRRCEIHRRYEENIIGRTCSTTNAHLSEAHEIQQERSHAERQPHFTCHTKSCPPNKHVMTTKWPSASRLQSVEQKFARGIDIGGDLREKQYQIATRCPPVIVWHPAIYSAHHLSRRVAMSSHSP